MRPKSQQIWDWWLTEIKGLTRHKKSWLADTQVHRPEVSVHLLHRLWSSQDQDLPLWGLSSNVNQSPVTEVCIIKAPIKLQLCQCQQHFRTFCAVICHMGLELHHLRVIKPTLVTERDPGNSSATAATVMLWQLFPLRPQGRAARCLNISSAGLCHTTRTSH